MATTNTADWDLATRLVRGATARSAHGETSEALFLTSGFAYPSAAEGEARTAGEAEGYVYGRFGNPTITMLEERLRWLEDAEACCATATGMAAVFAALMAQLRAGDHVVASRVMFGGCRLIVSDWLPRYGIETTLIDGRDTAAWRAALRPNTRCVLLESPANPTLELTDIAAVADLAHGVGARVVVDNVLATGLFQQPLALGADLVVYSTTKHVDGQGRCLGGAILGKRQLIEDEITPFLRTTGPTLSPFNAWVMLKGLETLPLRLERMCDHAERIAHWLDGKPGVAAVLYPALPHFPQRALAARQLRRGGTVIGLELAGGKAAAFAFLDRLRLIDISNNLGDTKSLATHPATTTHQKLGAAARAEAGISDGLIRLSIGLEAPADLEADLAQALSGQSVAPAPRLDKPLTEPDIARTGR